MVITGLSYIILHIGSIPINMNMISLKIISNKILFSQFSAFSKINNSYLIISLNSKIDINSRLFSNTSLVSFSSDDLTKSNSSDLNVSSVNNKDLNNSDNKPSAVLSDYKNNNNNNTKDNTDLTKLSVENTFSENVKLLNTKDMPNNDSPQKLNGDKIDIGVNLYDDTNSVSDIKYNNLSSKIDKIYEILDKDKGSTKSLNNSSGNKSPYLVDNDRYSNDKVVIYSGEDIFNYSSLKQFDLDFIIDSKESQIEVNGLFDYYVKQENAYIVPDLELSHVKSQSNRLILIKFSDNLPHKLEIWKKIYTFYFKSIFNIISKLNPLAVKHLRNLNTKLLTNESLTPTPAVNLTSNVESSVAKICYGFANGLHELAPFLSSKFRKIDIDYNFNLNIPRVHEISVNWYYINSKNKEIKISKTYKSSDLSFETSIVTDSWDFKDTESSFYAKSYNKVLSDLFTLDKADVEVETLQSSSYTKHVITANKGSSSTVEWTDGVSSRMITNGPIVFDFSNFYIFNTFISLLKIDNLLDIEDDVNDKVVNDLFIYLAAMIKHYVINKVSPSGMLLKVLNSKFTISSLPKASSALDLHNKYKSLIKSGDFYPNTPVQFDFYFYKDTILKFSQFIILSSFANIAINRSMKSILPHNDKLSKNNFYLYARDRSLLFSKTYITEVSFDFQLIESSFITFDELIVEMYIKTMIMTRVPDYIPLITRGQWKGNDVNSNLVYCSYLNDILVKFTFNKDYQDIINFILNIICSTKEYNLGKVFKRKTRLVSTCPDVFERFVFETNTEDKVLSKDLGVTDKDYLSD